MAHVLKRKGVQYGKPYEVRWSWYDDDGERRFGQERFASAREAKAKKREVEQAVADAHLFDTAAGRQTFAEWAERWYTVHSSSIKPSTARSYRSLLDKSVLPAFGPRRIRSVSTADVQAFVLGLHSRGLTPSTIRHHYGTVRLVLAEAARNKAITVNPALDVKLPTDRSTGRAKVEPHFLSPEEVARLAAACEHPYGLLVRFMVYTGLRGGEVAGLNIADVDLLHSRLAVRRTRRKVKPSAAHRDGWEEHTPKSGKTRHVPLPAWLADELRTYLSTHPNAAKAEAALWPGRVNGGLSRFAHQGGGLDWSKPWERDAFVKRQFKPALAAANLPSGVRLHDLRHSYVSILASAGVPSYRIAEYAGHASDSITRTTYMHLFQTDASADMDKLDRPTPTPSRVVAMRRRQG